MNLLNVKNLEICYGDTSILKNISFSVKEGEYIAIVGKNGTGKSTLIKTIVGLKNYTKGKIEIKLPLDDLSYLEQINTKNNDFPITVYEVVLSGLQKHLKFFYSKEDHKRVKELLELLEIEKIKNKNLGEISGGQRQRVLIARALAKKPKMLIMDEPLSGLDSKIEKEIYKILRDLNTKLNITIIMTSHDLKNIKKEVSRIIAIDDGKITFDDTADKWEVQ